MFVFIDDSGDTGFNFKKGSSRYFVISCIIFPNEDEAEKTAGAIKELKKNLHFSTATEFKFNGSRKDVKVKFFEAVNKFNFQVRTLVVDKSIIHSQELKTNKSSFYSYFIKLVLKNNDGQIIQAKIRIDGTGDRTFRKSFITYLRKNLNSEQTKIMDNCKLVDSKNNVLIQLADMVCGAIRRSYDVEKTDSSLYKSIFKKHIRNEWKFH